jgi:hypothetical protein
MLPSSALFMVASFPLTQSNFEVSVTKFIAKTIMNLVTHNATNELKRLINKLFTLDTYLNQFQPTL